MPVLKGISLWFSCLELLVSTAIHVFFAFALICQAAIHDSFFWQPSNLSAASAIADSVAATETAISFSKNLHVFQKNGLAARNHAVDSTKAPIVLVHGIFGFGNNKLGGISYWGGAEKRAENVIVSDVGALASIHDRACELFYQLKGGTVDYGLVHSQYCGHQRFGKTYSQGLYPQWSGKHPIHFVGHSSGVQTVRLLHTMLAEGAFKDHPETSEEWVVSVTSLSGCLNGTTRVYLDGLSTEDGRSIHWLGLLRVLAIGVIIYEWLDIRLFKRIYTFGFDHYGLSRRKAGLLGLVLGLAGLQGPFASGDWIIPDLSIQSTVELNRRLRTFPNTYYFSYATGQTVKAFGRHWPVPWSTHPIFTLRMLQMASWRRPRGTLPYDAYSDEEWHENDGAVNTASQLYPRLPVEHPHVLLTELTFNKGQSLRPGVWYYTTMQADHIHYVISRWRAGERFYALYDTIFQRCREQLTGNKTASFDSLCMCVEHCMCNIS